MVMHRLTVRQVAAMTKPGWHADGGGLYLAIKGGSRAWLFRFMRHGVAHGMGLGSVDAVTLQEARRAAEDLRRLLQRGEDPLQARRASTAALSATANRLNFETAADRYYQAHRSSWRSDRHAQNWKMTIDRYVTPIVGQVWVDEVETSHVVNILEPLWSTKPDTANRIRSRVEVILDWCQARGFRSAENPARWRGHIEALFPAPAKVQGVARGHMEAMPFADLPGFLQELREPQNWGVIGAALEFLTLTAARTGEVTGMTWEEVDLDARLWTIPGPRMKGGRPHRVPLSDRAVAILQAVREPGNPLCFVSDRTGQPLSPSTMRRRLLALRPGSGLTVHGMRSAFRDWCGEATAFPREVAEAALAHLVGDKAEQAYRRADSLEKRRRLMSAWSAYCTSPPTDGEVVPLRRRSQ